MAKKKIETVEMKNGEKKVCHRSEDGKYVFLDKAFIFDNKLMLYLLYVIAFAAILTMLIAIMLVLTIPGWLTQLQQSLILALQSNETLSTFTTSTGETFMLNV